MNRKLRVGVFGGERGNSMMQVLMNHPDAELVAVCDKYQPLLDKAKANADKYDLKIHCYNNFDDFIKEDMDAVVLANYATEHATFAIRCLNAGMHVFSEVLPSETMAQAVELIEAVEKTGLVYAYGENYCYMDSTFELWRRFQMGDIGELYYADAEYIHDCSSCWPSITYGERDHWRNHMYPTFYCSHSLGPIMMITNRRPVQVVGFENPPLEEFYRLGHSGGHASGIEMITMDNGAIVRSMHGPFKRQPSCGNYYVYGTKGYMGTTEDNQITVYKEGEELCKGTSEKYPPQKYVSASLAGRSGVNTHGGSDFYATHFFIEKILNREDGRFSIDVYKAVDMGICGILAYRSILNGNAPVKVPNLRNREERDLYRNDNACTTPAVAKEQLIPCSSHGERAISDEDYEKVKKMWLEGKKA